MLKEKIIPTMIGLPKSYRNILRKMALEESLKTPKGQNVSVSCLVRKIIADYLKNNKMEKLEEKVEEEDYVTDD